MNLIRPIRWGVVVGLAVVGHTALAQQPQVPGASIPGALMQSRIAPGLGTNPRAVLVGPGAIQPGMGGMFGSRVTPMMFLSVEDVRYYLGSQLERLKNKRLKVGETSADDGTITADIVTVDNSLVQRLRIDRHTGIIKYED